MGCVTLSFVAFLFLVLFSGHLFIDAPSSFISLNSKDFRSRRSQDDRIVIARDVSIFFSYKSEAKRAIK